MAILGEHVLEAYRILLKVGRIRVPTACWLFCDIFKIVDHDARNILQTMVSLQWIEIDNGGWIKTI